MTCDLFIRSYWKDLEWLQFCLASIKRYCRGFRAVVIVLPEGTKPWLHGTTLPKTVRVEFCKNYRDDYLGQQVTKLLADTFTDADHICHVDSDCIFSRPTSPDDLIDNGRPRVLMEPCALLGRHYPWKKPTEAFLGFPVLDDFMRQPPFTFPRAIYSLIRDHAVRTHSVDIETYVTAQPPRGFSEYNALGAFAWQFRHDGFSWTDVSASPAPEPHCRWYWSWGGIDETTRTEIRSILYDRTEPNGPR